MRHLLYTIGSTKWMTLANSLLVYLINLWSTSSQIHKWTKQYLEGGEAALVNKRKPGNPLAKYERRKELTPTEQLEYKIALLERELLKRDGEIARLKKSIELERGDAKRK